MSKENKILEFLPYLRVKGADEAIGFYTKVFGAREKYRMNEPGGRVAHAELILGNTILMLSDEYPEMNCPAPEPGKTGCVFSLTCENVDEMAKVAVEEGAALIREPQDAFYGHRSCLIRDPFGHEWMIGQVIEEVSDEEIQRRFREMCEKGEKPSD